MRTRFVTLAGLVLLAAAPALARAAAPVATQAADDKPAVVVAFKSLEGLIDDAKYIAKLAGKEEEAKQTEKMLQNMVGGPKGLEGVDPKKPIGMYVRINEDDPQKSEGVLLVPVADEEALLNLLKKQDKLTVGDKDSDDVYKVTAEGLPFPLFFRFANKYAYVTGQTKTALSSDRLLAPDTVLPNPGRPAWRRWCCTSPRSRRSTRTRPSATSPSRRRPNARRSTARRRRPRRPSASPPPSRGKSWSRASLKTAAT